MLVSHLCPGEEPETPSQRCPGQQEETQREWCAQGAGPTAQERRDPVWSSIACLPGSAGPLAHSLTEQLEAQVSNS